MARVLSLPSSQSSCHLRSAGRDGAIFEGIKHQVPGEETMGVRCQNVRMSKTQGGRTFGHPDKSVDPVVTVRSEIPRDGPSRQIRRPRPGRVWGDEKRRLTGLNRGRGIRRFCCAQRFGLAAPSSEAPKPRRAGAASYVLGLTPSLLPISF
jgi:hypothetical protein